MSANKPKTTGEGSGTGDGKMADENMELDERKVKILDAVIRNCGLGKSSSSYVR